MNFYKKILLFTPFFFTAVFSIAQQIKNESTADKYRAVHWGLNDGLSQACVLQMQKDVKGFLWMGTQGALSRFDGSLFKNYYHDPKKSGTINAKNTSFGLVEDSLHNIWIGTNNGLYRYNIKADTFSNLLPAAPLCATSSELFCLELPGSIISFNIHSFTKKTVATLTSTDSVGMGLNIFSSFLDERTNSLWILRSIQENNGWRGSGLMQISLTTGEKKYYTWNCYKNIPGHDHSAEAMCYDRKRNCIWINSEEGLMQFTLDDKQFHYIGALNNFFAAKDYGRWNGICLDLRGRVWLATRPKGIVIYDPSDHSIEFPFAEGSSLQKEISDNNAVLYCDGDGIIWSGFWIGKGIYQVLPSSPSFTHYKTDTLTNGFNIGTIQNFQNAGQGKMWIGSTDGLLRIFDTHTGNYQALSENDFPPDLRKTWIIPFMIDTIARRAYLYCFAKGFWIMDMITKKCQPLIFKDAANHEIAISEMRGNSPFKNGLLISATRDNRQSIFFVNGDSTTANEVFSFAVNPGNTFSLEMADDHFMFFKGSDATGNMTYTYTNNKWVRSPHPFDSISWIHMVYNKKDQGYWVTGEKELVHFNKDFRIIRVYTPVDGLPELDIYSLLPDLKGNIWFNTDRSIHQLNTQTGVFSTLSEKDGYTLQNFSGGPSIYMGADSDLYLGEGAEGNGFVRISPDKYANTASSVYMRSLEINQKPFSLSTGVNNVEDLSLRYFENKITIETGIIDYYAKGKSNIRYKLEAEGKTADWQYAPAYYTIRYENLSPGKYRLVMQASNAANEFSGPEKILLINISPAFWNTWWFRIIAVLCIIAIIYGLIRWRLQHRFRLQLERSENKTQMAELRQQKTEVEMQALRAQMNPHFIFNSLNSINRFILQNNRLEASEYLTKFSKLVRMILQNSQSSLIPLQSELESLGLYLEMEALRFNYHFDYKISIDKDIDIEILKVPPLILQPYVENAIWHGLMHKEEKGQLNIDVSQKDDHLLLKITDNGIGRKKAAEIAGKSATKHKSMGLRITANRIAMLQSSNGAESPVKINDLVEPDGTTAGTEVVIKMPVIEEG